jgi:hypothetical protein
MAYATQPTLSDNRCFHEMKDPAAGTEFGLTPSDLVDKT